MKKIIATIIGVFLFSCQEAEILENTLEVPKPKVIDQRLSFLSLQHLKQYVDESKSIDLEKFKEEIHSFELEGYTSLIPTFKPTDLHAIEAYISKSNRQSHSKAREDMIIDIDDNEIISDPNFALVLNENYEVLVDDIVYKFTDYGLFYAPTDSYEELVSYSKQVANCQLALASGDTYLGDNVYGFIPEPIDGICEYEIDYNENVVYSTTATSTTKDDFMNQMKTCDYKENVLNKIFGPSEKCIDHWASDRRIKTKTWNQNYLIYSSVGIKTKTQKRSLGIWWASDSDELELGYEVVKYRFDGVDFNAIGNEIRRASGGQNYFYEYNGYLINQYGIISQNNYWGSGTNLFSNWPISDPNSRVLKIYLGDPITNFMNKIDDDILSVTGKEINAQAKRLAKEGWDAVSKYLKVQSANGGAVIIGGNPLNNRFYFVYTNWSLNNKNDNKIQEVFDWNTAQIGISLNPGSGAVKPIYSSPKSYSEFAVSCYGIGRRGTTWKGGRILLVQK